MYFFLVDSPEKVWLRKNAAAAIVVIIVIARVHQEVQYCSLLIVMFLKEGVISEQ